MEEEQEINNPSYYAVIPAPVRYCKALNCYEKLLFAEISSLSNVRGYCFASNSHFASLYDVHKNTISKYISNLKDNGFIITFDEIRKDGSAQRRIKLTIDAYTGTPLNLPPLTTGFRGVNPTVNHNKNNIIVIDNNNKEDICENFEKEKETTVEIEQEQPKKKKKATAKKDFVAPSLDDVVAYFKEKGYSSFAGKKCFEYYDSANWTDRNGSPVINWKQKVLANWFKDEYLDKSTQAAQAEMIPHPKEYRFATHFQKMKFTTTEEMENLENYEKKLRSVGFVGKEGEIAMINKLTYEQLIKEHENKINNK